MPQSGNYHVEILLLLCEKYEEGFRSSLNLMTVCLADRTDENGLITSKNNSSIAVDLSHQRLGNKEARGRWLHKSLLSDQHQLRHNTYGLLEQPKPVLTRFQPESCVPMLNRNSSYCKQFNEDRLMGFNDYNFHWNLGPDAELNQPGLRSTLLEQYQRRLVQRVEVQPTMPGRLIQVCFLGASHSRILTNSSLDNLMVQFNDTEKLANAPFGCSWIGQTYPNRIGKSDSRQLGEMGCTHVVIGLFQWNFSFQRKRMGWDNINFTEWQDAMTEAVEFIRQESSGIKSPLRRILLRSAHPNGMGWKQRQCPPGDFRTPINAKIATNVVKEIADGFSRNTTLTPVSFIDTSFLIDPVWDAAPDWSHYEDEMEKISEVEAKFILSEILKEF